VLVVEDDALQRLAVGQLLRDWGCSPLMADSADAALTATRLAGSLDLIIADFRLPGGSSGLEAVERVRDLLGAQIPGLLLTGETCASDLGAAEAQGLHILRKPYHPRQLHRMVHLLLERGGTA
jgi:CheY-like chemotaxis protein